MGRDGGNLTRSGMLALGIALPVLAPASAQQQPNKEWVIQYQTCGSSGDLQSRLSACNYMVVNAPKSLLPVAYAMRAHVNVLSRNFQDADRDYDALFLLDPDLVTIRQVGQQALVDRVNSERVVVNRNTSIPQNVAATPPVSVAQRDFLPPDAEIIAKSNRLTDLCFNEKETNRKIEACTVLMTDQNLSSPELKPVWLVERAKAFNSIRDYKSALRDLDEAIAYDPNFAAFKRFGADNVGPKIVKVRDDLRRFVENSSTTASTKSVAPANVPVRSVAASRGSAGPISSGVGSAIAETRSAPGGVSVSGPDRTGANTVASPRIGAAPAAIRSVVGTTGSAAPNVMRAGDFTPVSDCVSIEQSKSHPFANKCGFKVTYTYCVLSPKQGAWSEAFKCEDQKFGNDEIGANNVNGAQNTGGITTYWFACRYPQLPIAKYERGRGAIGVCK